MTIVIKDDKIVFEEFIIKDANSDSIWTSDTPVRAKKNQIIIKLETELSDIKNMEKNFNVYNIPKKVTLVYCHKNPRAEIISNYLSLANISEKKRQLSKDDKNRHLIKFVVQAEKLTEVILTQTLISSVRDLYDYIYSPEQEEKSKENCIVELFGNNIETTMFKYDQINTEQVKFKKNDEKIDFEFLKDDYNTENIVYKREIRPDSIDYSLFGIIVDKKIIPIKEYIETYHTDKYLKIFNTLIELIAGSGFVITNHEGWSIDKNRQLIYNSAFNYIQKVIKE